MDEHGTVSGDSWLLKRANRTTLRVPVPEAGAAAGLERAAVTIARAAIDDFGVAVMLHLFAVANDPPNWRRPDFTLRLSDLLDRPGFKRDSRGVHRSDARRGLTTTLLALHPTHVRWRDGPVQAGDERPVRPGPAVAPGRPNLGRRSPVGDILPISTGHKGPRGHYSPALGSGNRPAVACGESGPGSHVRVNVGHGAHRALAPGGGFAHTSWTSSLNDGGACHGGWAAALALAGWEAAARQVGSRVAVTQGAWVMSVGQTPGRAGQR
jgi:hypothetical protein